MGNETGIALNGTKMYITMTFNSEQDIELIGHSTGPWLRRPTLDYVIYVTLKSRIFRELNKNIKALIFNWFYFMFLAG